MNFDEEGGKLYAARLAGQVDDAGFNEQIVRLAYPFLTRLSGSMNVSPAIRKDIVQETLIRFIGRGKTPDFRVNSLAGWFRRAMQWAHRDYLRKNRHDQDQQPLDETLPSNNPPLWRQIAFEQEFYKLPAAWRMALFLRREGYTAEETGKIMGKTPSAVEKYFLKARKRLSAGLLKRAKSSETAEGHV